MEELEEDKRKNESFRGNSLNHSKLSGTLNNSMMLEHDALGPNWAGTATKSPSRFAQNKNKSFILDQLLKCFEQIVGPSEERPRFSEKYYERRRSQDCKPVGRAAPAQGSTPTRNCLDDNDILSPRKEGVEALNRRMKERTDKAQEKGFNAVMLEAICCPEVAGYITNPETLKTLNLKKLNPEFKILQENRPNLIQIKVGSTEISDAKKSSSDHAKFTEAGLFPKKGLKNEAIFNRMKARESNRLQKAKMSSDTKVRVSGEQGKIHSQTVLNEMKFGERKLVLNEYVPICLFLCIKFDRLDLGTKLLYYDSALLKEIKPPFIKQLLNNQSFIARLLKSVLKYEEQKVYVTLMRLPPNWDLLFSDPVVSIFIQMDRLSYLFNFLTEFNLFLTKQNEALGLGKQVSQFTLTHLDTHKEADNKKVSLINLIGKSRMVTVIRKLLQTFENRESNQVILDLLRGLNYSDVQVVEILVLTQQEDRISAIFLENPHLVKWVAPSKIVELRLYKVLILLDPKELINIFNQLAFSGESQVTLFNELCTGIKSGVKIQALCFLILRVSITFWDYDKVWKFFTVVNEVLRYESKNNWMAYVDNPLLFCLKLTSFFLKVDKFLALESKEIAQLTDDLMKFCVSYIETSKEETLIINFFDKDAEGLNFFEYSFKVKKMELLEIEFVEHMIQNMWDLSRNSKQSLQDFFRLNVFDKENSDISLRTFQRDYIMPVEETDAFQLEFYLTSRSVFISVLSDLVWPLALILLEVHFSLWVVGEFKESGTAKFRLSMAWLADYFKQHPKISYLLIYLRLSYTATAVLRSLTLQSSHKTGVFDRKYFYLLSVLLYLAQLLICPWLREGFWLINNLQMLVVMTLIAHSFFLGLSLNQIGVILRIFARMVTVVLAFSCVSILVITLIAYPIHTLFVDFSQVEYSQVFPQLNMFRSLYNGVLTLFEFVFGAVVLVRPYIEENYYTYAMGLFMVIFSFFGNIMLANMLVAFLASQFEAITQRAKYYTLKMQYALSRAFRAKDLDSIYSMPFVFNLLLLPVFLLMARPGKTRKRINLYLKRSIHGVNVFVPWLLYYLVYLLLAAVYRYAKYCLKSLAAVLTRPASALFFCVWVVVGPFFLLKLMVSDLCFLCKVILNFRDTTEEDDLYSIVLTAEEKERLVAAFQHISNVANHLLVKRKLQVVNLGELIYEISRTYPEEFSSSKEKKNDEEVGGEADGGQFDSADSVYFNKNKYLFDRKYNAQGTQLYNMLLKKFVSFEETGAVGAMVSHEIDLKFVAEKCKNNVNPENIHILVAFEKSSLEQARKQMQTSDEGEMKAEINIIKEQVAQLTQSMSTLTQCILRIDPRLLQPQPQSLVQQ